MKTLQKELDRRQLLRYLSRSALALPFMRTLAETEAFGAVAAKRAVFFYFPDGMIASQFQPSGMGSLGSLPAMTQPLQDLSSDLIFLKNVNYLTEGSHEGGAGYVLTGVPNQGPGISIDTVLGEALKGSSLRPVARLGVGTNYQSGKAISYFAEGQAAVIEDHPLRAFQDYFGGFVTSAAGSTGANKSLSNSKAFEQSVLDFCLEDIKGLQSRLGGIEKQKLDTHLQSLRELERRLKSPMVMEAARECTAKVDFRGTNFPLDDSGYPKPHHQNDVFGVVGDIMTDLAVQVLACGISRVLYLQWSRPVSPTVFNFPGGPAIARGHHEISHYGGEGNAQGIQEFASCQKWYMQQLANLLKKLKAVREGDKSLLHNTALLAFTEIADSDRHSFDNAGIILAGQAGGQWRTGRAIDTRGASQNQVLVSILQSFGIARDSFGDASLGRGAIAGLNG